MFKQDALIKEMNGLRGFAWRLTNNKADAEDLVQSTALRALEKKHLFREGSNLFSWTSKIMYNLFVTAYRRKTKFETQYDPESYIERESVEASQEKKMEFQQVRDAIETLSPAHREILILVCIKGMRYADVAEKLELPVGTVRSRLSRARSALDQKLEYKADNVHIPLSQDTHSYAQAA